jgi:hypothetical protein
MVAAVALLLLLQPAAGSGLMGRSYTMVPNICTIDAFDVSNTTAFGRITFGASGASLSLGSKNAAGKMTPLGMGGICDCVHASANSFDRSCVTDTAGGDVYNIRRWPSMGFSNGPYNDGIMSNVTFGTNGQNFTWTCRQSESARRRRLKSSSKVMSGVSESNGAYLALQCANSDCSNLRGKYSSFDEGNGETNDENSNHCNSLSFTESPNPSPPPTPMPGALAHQQWVGPSTETKQTILFMADKTKCVDLLGGNTSKIGDLWQRSA